MTTSTPGKRPMYVVASCLLVSGLLTFLGGLAATNQDVKYLLFVLTVVLWVNAVMLWAADRHSVAPPSPAPRDDWA